VREAFQDVIFHRKGSVVRIGLGKGGDKHRKKKKGRHGNERLTKELFEENPQNHANPSKDPQKKKGKGKEKMKEVTGSNLT